jgi:hypothetical protein
VSVVFCQVEVSATSWSLVQRSLTDCGASQICVIIKPRRNEVAQANIGLSSHRGKKKKKPVYLSIYQSIYLYISPKLGFQAVGSVWQVIHLFNLHYIYTLIRLINLIYIIIRPIKFNCILIGSWRSLTRGWGFVYITAYPYTNTTHRLNEACIITTSQKRIKYFQDI